jgi:hypothetical protein
MTWHLHVEPFGERGAAHDDGITHGRIEAFSQDPTVRHHTQVACIHHIQAYGDPDVRTHLIINQACHDGPRLMTADIYT